MQTAGLLEWDAGWPAAVADEAFDVNHDPKDAIKRIKQLPPDHQVVAVVGHGDELKQLADYLLGSEPEPNTATPSVSFDKGGAAMITTKRSMKPGSGTLKWAMRQKELKQHR